MYLCSMFEGVDRLHGFKEDVSHIDLPEQFNYPFYYTPHELGKIASAQLQALIEQNPWGHNFGFDPSRTDMVIGKMFGVLVVKTPSGKLGILYGVSGKLANSNQHREFVPPVFDLLDSDGFYKKEEAKVNEINATLEFLEKSGIEKEVKTWFDRSNSALDRELSSFKEEMKVKKAQRSKLRDEYNATFEGETLRLALESLRLASVEQSFALKDLQSRIREEKEALVNKRDLRLSEINNLRIKRKELSNGIQKKIFQHYTFNNGDLEKKSLYTIFQGEPPAGAGECAAPKLLEYAFIHGLTPITMAEFWWGASPKSEVRKHKNYYPSCRGKCEPILGHMLQGMNVDENPMLINPAEGKELSLVHEDKDFVIVNKPSEFLSVPGKTISDSVYERVRNAYPEATGPLIVHRLDQSTSGLMVLALNEDAYKIIQSQFIERKVKKTYEALLEGELEADGGEIKLPLRVDLDNRPMQLVCYEYGKDAHTKYYVISRENGRTRVHFFPITGRTHQLRVHSAHSSGLNTPIVGDDLYGQKDVRLHLHAKKLEFDHPRTGHRLSFTVEAEF